MVNQRYQLLLVGVGVVVRVDEVAALSELALSLLRVGQALFGFVGALLVAGGFELLGSVGELAPGSVGAAAMERVVFAEGGLAFGMLFCLLGRDIVAFCLLVVGGDVRFVVEVAGGGCSQTGVLFFDAHGGGLQNIMMLF